MLGNYEINLKENTLLYQIYNHRNKIIERFRTKYIVPFDYLDKLEKYGLVLSGFVKENIIISIELPQNLFFVCIQYHPEFKSRPFIGHPLFNSFLQSSIKYETINKNKFI